MDLAQGHKAVTPVRLEPVALRSRDKHITTEGDRELIAYLGSQLPCFGLFKKQLGFSIRYFLLVLFI